MAVENNRYRFSPVATVGAATAANKMQIRFNIAQAFTLDENFELFAFKRKETALRNYVIKWSFSWRIFPQGEGTRNHARDSSRSPLLHLGRITKFFLLFSSFLGQVRFH